VIVRSKLVLAQGCADPSGFLGIDSALGARVKLFKLRSVEHAPSTDASALKATAHKLIRFARRPAKARHSLIGRSFPRFCSAMCPRSTFSFRRNLSVTRSRRGRSWAIRSDRGECVLSATTRDSPERYCMSHSSQGPRRHCQSRGLSADFGGLTQVSGLSVGGALLAANRQKVFIVAEISQPKRSQPVKKGALNS
jgi:hypothetical protein